MNPDSHCRVRFQLKISFFRKINMREKRKAKKGQNDFDFNSQVRVRNHTLTQAFCSFMKNFFRELTLNSLPLSRTRNSIFFREFTRDPLIFRVSSLNILFFREITLNPLSFSWIHYKFTIFSRSHYESINFYAYWLWIPYLFREFTIDP